MFGRETRMLLRHYLEQGTSKSALARQMGVSRDTIHRWIRDGDLDRDSDTTPVQYGPRAPVPTKLDAVQPIIEARPRGISGHSTQRLRRRDAAEVAGSEFLHPSGCSIARLQKTSVERMIRAQGQRETAGAEPRRSLSKDRRGD